MPQQNNKSSSRATHGFRLLAYSILTLFALGALAMTVFGLYNLAADYLAISRATQVPASVTATEVVTHTRTNKGRKRYSYSPSANYSYTFKGQTFTASAVFNRPIRSSRVHAETARQLAAVATTAYIDPSDPSKSFLLPWRETSSAGLVAVSGLMLGVGAFVAGGVKILGSRTPTRTSSGTFALAIYRSPITRRNTLAAISAPLYLCSLIPLSFYLTEPTQRPLPVEIHVFSAVLLSLATLTTAALAYFYFSARALPYAAIHSPTPSVTLGSACPLQVSLKPSIHASGQALLRIRCIRTVTTKRGKGSSTSSETLAEILLPLGTISPAFHSRTVSFDTTLTLPDHLPPTHSTGNTETAYLARLILNRPQAVDAAIDFHLPVAKSGLSAS